MGVAHEFLDGGERADDHEHLIREESAGDFDEAGLQAHEEVLPAGALHDEGDGGGDAAFLLDGEALFLEEPAEGGEGEEAGVGEVEDAAFVVVELAEEEHEAGDAEADVAGGDDDLDGEVRLGAAAEFVAEFLGGREVLDDVEDENDLHVVEGANGEGRAQASHRYAVEPERCHR